MYHNSVFRLISLDFKLFHFHESESFYFPIISPRKLSEKSIKLKQLMLIPPHINTYITAIAIKKPHLPNSSEVQIKLNFASKLLFKKH